MEKESQVMERVPAVLQFWQLRVRVDSTPGTGARVRDLFVMVFVRSKVWEVSVEVAVGAGRVREGRNGVGTVLVGWTCRRRRARCGRRMCSSWVWPRFKENLLKVLCQ